MSRPDSMTRLAHLFVYNRYQESKVRHDKETARDAIKDYLMNDENARIDEYGHRYLDLSAPIPDGDALVTAIRATRNVSASIDLDLAAILLREKDLYDRVFKRVVTREFDENELYALNQQGLVSDEELDSMIIENVTYSIGSVKS
jgi:hypothetical protein